MVSLIAAIVLFTALFLASYLTKRRLGALGLALAAGALLSMHWANSLTPFLEKQGVVLITPPLSALVQILLTLGPPSLLLMGGPTYTRQFARIASSLAFAVLAVTFLTEVLASILVLDPTSSAFFSFLHDHKSTIITTGLIAALVDALLAGLQKHKSKKATH